MSKKFILNGMEIGKGRLRGLMWTAGLLCYSLLLSPLYVVAEMCSLVDYNNPTIAAGEYHTVGIREDGTVVADGDNFYGQLNTSSWSNIKAVSAGYGHTVGLKEDGTVVAVGYNYAGQLNTSSWTGIKAVAAGVVHTVGLREDGTVVAVGWNDYGQTNVSSWSNIKAIAAGYYHTVGLKEDGTVVAVGWNYYGQLNTSSWSNIKAIAASTQSTVGLKEDGTVVAVGNNSFGQLNTSSWTNIKAVAAGDILTVGLREDGTVVAVGDNAFHELNATSWSNIKAIDVGLRFIIGLKEDGTMVAAGWYDYTRQPNISGWTNIRQPGCLANMVSPPSSLVASDIPCDNGGSIALSWTLSPDDPTVGTGNNKVTVHNIYRADSPNGPYAAIGNVGAGTGSYVDNGAVTGTTYYYVVRATDGMTESLDSNEASAAPVRNLPLSPTGLSASDTPYDLGGSITLAWTVSADDGAGLNNVSAYNIYRYSAADGTIGAIASLPAGTASYMDGSTVDTDTYYYFTKAFDGICNKESEASDVVTGQSANNLTSASGDIIGIINDPNTPPAAQRRLERAVDNIQDAQNLLLQGDIAGALGELSNAIRDLARADRRSVETDALQKQLAETALRIFSEYIAQARSVLGPANRAVVAAEAVLAAAQADIGAGEYRDAANRIEQGAVDLERALRRAGR